MEDALLLLNDELLDEILLEGLSLDDFFFDGKLEARELLGDDEL